MACTRAYGGENRYENLGTKIVDGENIGRNLTSPMPQCHFFPHFPARISAFSSFQSPLGLDGSRAVASLFEHIYFRNGNEYARTYSLPLRE